MKKRIWRFRYSSCNCCSLFKRKYDCTIVPEKRDLNDILFLLTQAESFDKIENLVNKLCEFEHLIDKNVLVERMLPDLVQKCEKYKGFTIEQLCQEMHNFYKDNYIALMQKK